LHNFLARGISNFEFHLDWGYYLKMFDICIKFPNSIYRTIYDEAMCKGPQIS